MLAVAFDVIEFDAYAIDPFAIRFGVGERVLEFLVVDNAAFFKVDQEHLARLQTPFLDNFFFGDGQASAF